MKLNKLIKNLDVEKIIGNTDVEIESICVDSKEVGQNSLFFCIKGENSDGHEFIKQAENYGAIAVVCERQIDTSLTQIIVKNSRIAMSVIASEFYGRADKELKIVGITGTNGKTTTSFMLYEIFKKAGIKCAVIGTLGSFYDGGSIEPSLTTPDPIELHRQFRIMREKNVKVVIMEVSAHALYYDKLHGISFETVVFTNLTQDHLDFFHGMEEYKKAKLKLFNELSSTYVVSNVDDEAGREIIKLNKKAISYGVNNPSDVFAISIEQSNKGMKFVINLFDLVYDVDIEFLGEFNVYNALAAATTSALMGVKPDKIIRALNNMQSVSGRLEKVYGQEFSVYVDYAHTPDGLEKSLKALKQKCEGKLVCVFGCGGNRDKDKRSKMGRISGEVADFTVITSDNPRFEEPMEIMNEIERGMLTVSKNYVLVQERYQAIEYALNLMREKDILLVAGKGCENYQEILGIKRLYNDKDTIEELLRGR